MKWHTRRHSASFVIRVRIVLRRFGETGANARFVERNPPPVESRIVTTTAAAAATTEVVGTGG
jgi:hypothetical protein